MYLSIQIIGGCKSSVRFQYMARLAMILITILEMNVLLAWYNIFLQYTVESSLRFIQKYIFVLKLKCRNSSQKIVISGECYTLDWNNSFHHRGRSNSFWLFIIGLFPTVVINQNPIWTTYLVWNYWNFGWFGDQFHPKSPRSAVLGISMFDS